MNPDRNPDHAPDSNPDPITGEPGSHPVSTGVGAAALGTAGLVAAAAVAGPIGIAAAAVGGAIIGGYAGKALGEVIDPTTEDAHWRAEHGRQDFGREGRFEEYQDAYRTGYTGYDQHGGRERSFEAAEPELRASYERNNPTIPWDKARQATRAAWERVHRGEAKRVPVQSAQGTSGTSGSGNTQGGSMSSMNIPG